MPLAQELPLEQKLFQDKAINEPNALQWDLQSLNTPDQVPINSLQNEPEQEPEFDEVSNIHSPTDQVH